MNAFRSLTHVFISLSFVGLLFGFESIYFPFRQNEFTALPDISLYLLAFCSLALTFVFVYLALSSSYGYRLFYLAAFSFATIAEYGYYSALQHYSTAEDLENVIFGTNLDNKIDAVMIYLNWTAVIPCVIFLILLICVKPIRHKNSWKYAANFSLIAAGFFLFTGYLTDNNYPITASGACYRTLISSPLKLNYLNLTPRHLVEYQAVVAPQKNIVVIIDESISGNHLSINGYDRPTTPFLEKLNERGFVRNWGLAVSGTTCSITSNKLLLTGVTDLPDKTKQLMNNPIIFQYAKAMGYKTFYFDGQMNNLWSLSDFDRQFVDEYIPKDDLQTANDFEIDGEIARRIREINQTSTGNFIWVNKRGTHTPYQRAYPKSAELWTPVFFADPNPTFSDPAEEKQALINSHNNAVRYNLELFFTELFKDGVEENGFYIYTSDHGQNLKDVPEQGSHCGDAPQQAIVPLLLLANSKKIPKTDTAYKASHSNIFATLLDLMNFPAGERKFAYHTSLLEAKSGDSKQRYYFVGDIAGNGAGRKIFFDEYLISRK